jgi:hypothetical protein
MRQFYPMAKEAGFRKHNTGKSAPARSPRRADDLSCEAVTQETLDLARYITNVTAQLEAKAIAARLDLLAYFLGMAKAESEIFVRINDVHIAESAEDQSKTSLQLD